MWLAKDVSIQRTLSTLTAGSISCTHSLSALWACNPISSGDKGTSSRGRHYSWKKATDLIRSAKGCFVSETLQDQGTLKAQEVVKAWLSPPATADPKPPHRAVLTARQRCLAVLTWQVRSLLHSYGKTQTSLPHASYTHVYFLIDLY